MRRDSIRKSISPLAESSPVSASKRIIKQNDDFYKPKKKEKALNSLEVYLKDPYPITRPEKVEINEIFEELYTIDILGLEKASIGAEKIDSNEYYLRLKQLISNSGEPLDQDILIPEHERQQILCKYLDIVLKDWIEEEAKQSQSSTKLKQKKINTNTMTTSELNMRLSKQKFIAQNIAKVLSFQTMLKKSSKYSGCLITQNIPKLIATGSFTRTELFEFFTVFKTLCDVTSQKLKMEGKKQHTGIERDIWSKGVVKLDILGNYLIKKIYFLLDVKNEGYIDWSEFIKGMTITNTRTFKDKIDLFVQICDDNGNGMLDSDEVYNHCKIFLQRFMRNINPEFLEDLTQYFTKFVFETCGYQLDQEIPASLIRELIMSVSIYLNLFSKFLLDRNTPTPIFYACSAQLIQDKVNQLNSK